MSMHWTPGGDATPLADDITVEPAGAAPAKKHWPEGATAGLLLVAAACVGVAVLVYKVAGPSDVFAR